MIRVVVADDQTLIRTGLRVMIESEPDLELVAEAIDGPTALQAVRRNRPDVVLMDIRMPGLDGIQALREITSDTRLAATRVVMLTTFELDEYVFDSLSAGASGFLLKDAEPADLLRAIRVVAAGESLLAPAVTRRVIDAFATRRRRPNPRVAELTEREREVVGLVAEGMSNDEIAEFLVVSPATVRTHVSRSMMKLRARDRAQLVVFAYQSGLTAT